jgi:hypothetical protein
VLAVEILFFLFVLLWSASHARACLQRTSLIDQTPIRHFRRRVGTPTGENALAGEVNTGGGAVILRADPRLSLIDKGGHVLGMKDDMDRLIVRRGLHWSALGLEM